MTALVPSITSRNSKSATTSSAQLVPADPQRVALLVQNLGSVNIGIAPNDETAAIGTAGTVTLSPLSYFDGVIDGHDCVKNAFTFISATGTVAVTVWEVLA